MPLKMKYQIYIRRWVHTDTKYHIWLANMVLIKEANNRWCMCVDFTDLNVACPNDLYPLLDMDRLIKGSSSYRMLSFMNSYSGYNYIQMDPIYAPKISFMSNHGKYYYNALRLQKYWSYLQATHGCHVLRPDCHNL